MAPLASLASLAPLASLAVLACSSPQSSLTDASVDVPPSAQTAPTAPAALCVAVAQDAEAKGFFRAYLGDAIVLKVSPDFTDHAAVESLLVSNGAVAAEPFATDTALLSNGRFTAPIIVNGRDLSALAPYVRAGSVAKMGQSDVAIAESVAARFAVGLGSALTILRLPPWTFGRERKLVRSSVRVAAILRVPGDAIHHYGERTIFATLEGARWSSAASLSEPYAAPSTPEARAVGDETTGIRVTGDPTRASTWADILAKERAPSQFRVLAGSELTEPGYGLALGSATAVCSSPVPAAGRPRQDASDLCSDLRALDASKKPRSDLFGQSYVVSPDVEEVLKQASSRKAEKVERGLVLNGAIASGTGLRFTIVDALDRARRDLLADHVVRGDLGGLTTDHGVALSADLAAALGVDLGSEIVLHATAGSSTDTSTYRVWRAPVVALVTLPAEAAHRLGLEWVWADDAEIRARWSLASDHHNIVRIQWGAEDPLPFVSMMSAGIALQNVLDTPRAPELELFTAACAPPP